MANIEDALPTIFVHEGRYVDNKKDPGGATNFGISLRFLLSTGDLDKDGLPDGDIDQDGDVDTDDIKKMTVEDATKLYRLYFWEPNNYGQIENIEIATKVFDIGINTGAKPANKCLQRALRAIQKGPRVYDDGALGPISLSAINRSPSGILLAALKSEAAGYYRAIRYQGSQDFLKGWLNRAYSDMVK